MIDWTKPIQTPEGKPARVLGTIKSGAEKLKVVAVDHGTWEAAIPCNNYGKNSLEEKCVINVPRKHVRWVNLYPNFPGAVHPTRELADKLAGNDRIACIKIEFKEGEGL